MTDTEVYDKFFIDEEYELENAPSATYSYRSGWNNALKRASIIIRNEIRPQGEWLHDGINVEGMDLYRCSICNRTIVTWSSRLNEYPYCHCGAIMKGGAE